MLRIKRYGVETLVAVILLIMIVGAVATILYLWLSQYTSISTSQLQTTAIVEDFQIDGYNYTYLANTPILTIYVHNTGITPIQLSIAYVAYYLNNSIVDKCINDTQWIRDVIIQPGEVQKVLIKNCNLKDQETYVIVVVTTRGTLRSFVFTYTS